MTEMSFFLFWVSTFNGYKRNFTNSSFVLHKFYELFQVCEFLSSPTFGCSVLWAIITL